MLGKLIELGSSSTRTAINCLVCIRNALDWNAVLASILIIPIGFDIDTNQGKCTVSGGINYFVVGAKPLSFDQ